MFRTSCWGAITLWQHPGDHDCSIVASAVGTAPGDLPLLGAGELLKDLHGSGHHAGRQAARERGADPNQEGAGGSPRVTGGGEREGSPLPGSIFI